MNGLNKGENGMNKSIGELRNHYVPRFILKNFGSSISCFNPKTGELKYDRTPESIYFETGIYTDELEKKFNERMECSFSQILSKLLDKDCITLKRKDIWTIKRFLLLETLRTPVPQTFIGDFRKNLRECVESCPDLARSIFGRHIDDVESNESDTEYWLRTMNFILDEDEFTTGAVDRSENGTALAYYFTLAFSAGYLGFWDSPDTDDFIITDVGFTSEIETGWFEGNSWMSKKPLIVLDAVSRIKDRSSELNLYTSVLVRWMQAFQENFYMFPISSKRMFVLINPFFKFVLTNSWMFQDDILKVITEMPDKRLFKPNESSCDAMGKHENKDTYTYRPVLLRPDQVQYCNALLLDRVENWVGFSSMEKMERSILYYNAKGDARCRNDYGILMDIIRKSRN